MVLKIKSPCGNVPVCGFYRIDDFVKHVMGTYQGKIIYDGGLFLPLSLNVKIQNVNYTLVENGILYEDECENFLSFLESLIIKENAEENEMYEEDCSITFFDFAEEIIVDEFEREMTIKI